jgi:hypothetical protein
MVAVSCIGGAGSPYGSEPPVTSAGPSISPAASPPVASPPAAIPPPTSPPPLNFDTDGWRTDFSRTSVDLTEIWSGGPPRDGIPPVDDPKYVSIAEARQGLEDQDPVIVLERGGRARAYPLEILIWHEIVNDTLGGVPVVVSFCPLCNTALVFERTVDGTVYDFGTSGNLRYSDLVMWDRQTESWWQQASGTAIVGELTGTQLTFLPAQIVGFADYAAAYPDGDVLSRDTGFRRDYGVNPYPGYDRADVKPWLYIGPEIDERLDPKERVVTVGTGEDAWTYPYTELEKTGVATGALGGQPYVVLWEPGARSALDTSLIEHASDVGATGVFVSSVGGQPLTIRREGPAGAPLRDVDTGSTWSVTGVATNGPLAGSRLTPVVHGDHFWFAWAAFFPDPKIWRAP